MHLGVITPTGQNGNCEKRNLDFQSCKDTHSRLHIFTCGSRFYKTGGRVQGKDEEHHEIDVTNGIQTRNPKWRKTLQAHAAFSKWHSVTGTKAGVQIEIDNIRGKMSACACSTQLKGCLCRNSLGLPLLPGNRARETSIMKLLPNDKVWRHSAEEHTCTQN